MQPIATDVACSVVCLSVCISSHGCAVQNWLYLSRCCLRGRLLCAVNYLLDGDSRSPTRMGNFGGLSKTLWVCCSVRSKRDHLDLNNGTTEELVQATAMPPTVWCHITLSLVNPPPFATQPFIRIPWPPVIVRLHRWAQWTNYVLDWVHILKGSGNFWMLSAPLKSI